MIQISVNKLQSITYYDELSDFQYNTDTKEISFFEWSFENMPFEWSLENINQTSVVHEELVIPKTFA